MQSMNNFLSLNKLTLDQLKDLGYELTSNDKFNLIISGPPLSGKSSLKSVFIKEFGISPKRIHLTNTTLDNRMVADNGKTSYNPILTAIIQTFGPEAIVRIIKLQTPDQPLDDDIEGDLRLFIWE